MSRQPSRSRTFRLILAISLIPLWVGCDGRTAEPPEPSTITISPTSATLRSLGDSVPLAAIVRDQNGQTMPEVPVSWASDEPAVATVGTSGMATAARNGRATVIARVGAVSASAAILVEQEVADVTVLPSPDTLVAFGDTVRLMAQGRDANGHMVDGAMFSWTSDDTLVAVVDEGGLVTGRASGTTAVVARSAKVTGRTVIMVVARFVTNSDRAALVALYEATDGPNWTNNESWLTDKPLGDWYGVSVDDQGRVTVLWLAGNNLTGSIPSELGNLGSLETLLLFSNDLTGPIPPALGRLNRLKTLYVSSSNLTGTIPPELGNLDSLRVLLLFDNELTGLIPPEVGRLDRLEALYLSGNNLTGAIPPELGSLGNLREMSLAGNNLTGPIPPELGRLTRLWLLHLGNNELTGGLPRSFGDLEELRYLLLSNNAALSGELPLELSNLTSLDVLHAGGTALCAPSDPAFQAWLEGIRTRRIALCEPQVATYLTQVVQSSAFPVPLVAGEKALLRVFLTVKTYTDQGIPAVRARFYRDGRPSYVKYIMAKSDPIPTEVDEGDLSKSVNAEIPGRVIQPGLEMVLEIDPDTTLDVELGVPRRIPETGRLAVDVRAMPLLDLTQIPFLWTSDPDSSIVELIETIAADPGSHEMLWDTRTLLPIGDMYVTAHEPVLTSSNNAYDLLTQTTAVRSLEGGTGYYMGMMSGTVTPANIGGVAYLSYPASFARPQADLVAHELGHNLSLGHAPCGGPGWVDLGFPYSDGSIGAWGYDFRDGGSLVPPSMWDLMSYCDPYWISDYHFTNALGFRLEIERAAPPSLVSPTESLLLWGGIGADGVPFLEPAFVVDAPPRMPRSAGEYHLTGRTDNGAEVFSLNFGMPEIADGDGRSSFAFVLPVRQGWAGSLASITLAGPGGSVTLDGDSELSMAILRNPMTGQVRAIIRDLPKHIRTWEDAAAALPIGSSLELLFSRGVPGAAAWMR